MPLLEVRGLTKYFGGLPAVRDLDFHVDEGEILALIGPNGAGKSTVFNLITAYLKPTGGAIVFQGEDITHLTTHKIAAKGIVRTFQQTTLFKEMTVFQNVVTAHHLLCTAGSWGNFLNSPSSRRDEEEFRRETLGILEYLGLSPYKDDLAKNLPHGHQRALGIAIALAIKPKLMLLDEPFTGMNPEETDGAMKMVDGIRTKGITIILVEHDMRAVMRISDRILVINFGRKIAEGKPEEIQRNENVIEAYLGKEKV